MKKRTKYIAVRLTAFQWEIVRGAMGCIEAMGTEHEVLASYYLESDAEGDRAFRAFERAMKVLRGARPEEDEEEQP